MQKRWIPPILLLMLGVQTIGALGECKDKTQVCFDRWQELDAGIADKLMCDLCESACQEAQNVCADDPKKSLLETANTYLRGCKNVCS